ncbi:unnamed protein product [Cyclocybe aegerita]|uniref:Zn(2)-C6 fungal-type domain-containing protein n=1 Tax=Cyclocybe aegerita TaxID=1973307 RepID=A0A8S0XM81_CYCAE|nr:unnamed protein product [Cyclocybe aegerita]
MSRSRSASMEIVPPTNSRHRGLADVMDAMFKSNHKESEDLRDEDADAEADDEELPPPQAAPAESGVPNAPTPCERCQRTGKTCKGVAGARCEHCKRLKQRCSNSTGPARGKHAAAAKKAGESANATKATPAKASTSHAISAANHLKRKSPGKASSPANGDIDGHSIDGEGSIDDEDGHEPPPRLNKKRRISKGNGGPSRAQLVKAVGEIEASIKRVQSTVAKEVEKMSGVIKSLNTKIKEMDDD